ncbi:MAG: DUF362 domain-containing protein [Kiritimatiellaeota bacterium]|nr:DUF362 domain-containing protein [Kiritimatiellota bacterium]
MHPALQYFRRRDFLRVGTAALAGLALPPVRAVNTAGGKVAIVKCASYGSEMARALAQSFALLGGLGALVKGKTVTVKLNLTGSDFHTVLGRPAGESFVTHPATGMALAAALFAAGAQRVRFVESTNLREPLEQTLVTAGWDVRALQALGRVELENTRNLGRGKEYATLKVPGGGHLFESFELNHAYEETDVFVSLCKLKLHETTGVTLTMKNIFGTTPNSLYGDDAPTEGATQGRGRMHEAPGMFDPPGAKEAFAEKRDGGYRIPRIITDLCGARPIQLGIIDGISTLSHGEGPWNTGQPQRIVTPGVLICGLNPVATDAVGTAVMGFANPRAPRGTAPFLPGDNHLVLAERAGLGTADLAQIEVLGVPLEKARCKQFVP